MGRNKYGKVRPKSVVRRDAWFTLIFGLLLGSFVVLYALQWSPSATWENSIHDTARFILHDVGRGRKGGLRQIFIICEERDLLVVETPCATWALADALDELESGTELTLVIHPNGETVLELWAEGRQLLEFQESAKRLRQDRNFLMVVGLIFYGFALDSTVCLVKLRCDRQKKRRNP